MSKIDDFEEAFRVIQIDEHHYVGAHPLRFPVKSARGVYGGHMMAQLFVVGIESTKVNDEYPYLPHSFHVYFIRAGSNKGPMEYTVDKIPGQDGLETRHIVATQQGKVRATASCSFVSRKHLGDKSKAAEALGVLGASALEYGTHIPVPKWERKHPDKSKLYQTHHTGWVRNAYSEEFINYEKAPEEDVLHPSQRWITVWCGINNVLKPEWQNRESEIAQKMLQPKGPSDGQDLADNGPRSFEGDDTYVPSKYQQSFRNPIYNLVGLIDASDSVLLTTLARILHLPWNPTIDNPFVDFDSDRDARHLMKMSLNILHIFHYNAMSLDHHVYFHVENLESAFDIVQEWLCFTYQVKRLSNNRTLLRGHMLNKNNKVVATIVQEGLTYMFNGVPDKAKLGETVKL